MSGPVQAVARERVAAASRRLAAEGLLYGTAGNLSELIGTDLVAVTPTGSRLESLEADQVPVVDLDGRVVAGELEPTSEIELHLGIYRRYEAGAVVHTHAPMATAVGCVLHELPCVHYQMLELGGPVRVAPYRTFGTAELAESTLEALAGRRAALMSNHGAVTYGSDLEQAIERSVLLEWACTLYWRAAALGKPRVLGEDELQEVVEALARREYGATRRAAPEGRAHR